MTSKTLTPLLEVEGLTVRHLVGPEPLTAVREVSFAVAAGRTLAVVGESGAGKSSVATAVMGLHGPGEAQVTGSVRFEGRELGTASARELRRLRGNRVAMVFQDPSSALHPYFTAGAQVAEAHRVHHRVSRARARRRALEALDLVGLPDPARAFGQHPHLMSGGERQRVMIAMALVNEPALLVADEPTGSLDPTVQADVLDLLVRVQDELGTALLLVTHDIGVVARAAHDVLVMYAGRVVEHGTAEDVLHRPSMPYTRALLGAVPDLRTDPGLPLPAIAGQPASPSRPPSGCAFHPRCDVRDRVVDDLCRTRAPGLLRVPEVGEAGQWSRCHLADPALRRPQRGSSDG